MKRYLFFGLIIFLTGYSNLRAQFPFRVESVRAEAGTDVNVRLLLSSGVRVAGISFRLLFDNSKLKIISSTTGNDAAAFTEIGVDADTANYSGELRVSLVDFSFSEPIMYGTDKEVYKITFHVDSSACGIFDLTLKDLSTSGATAWDPEYFIIDGSITVPCRKPGDVNEDGVVNIQDLLALLQILAGRYN